MTTSPRSRFGEWLSREREASGLSVNKLEAMISRGRGFIGRLEGGRGKLPDRATCQEIELALQQHNALLEDGVVWQRAAPALLSEHPDLEAWVQDRLNATGSVTLTDAETRLLTLLREGGDPVVGVVEDIVRPFYVLPDGFTALHQLARSIRSASRPLQPEEADEEILDLVASNHRMSDEQLLNTLRRWRVTPEGGFLEGGALARLLDAWFQYETTHRRTAVPLLLRALRGRPWVAAHYVQRVLDLLRDEPDAP